jgi:hypothetical protein
VLYVVLAVDFLGLKASPSTSDRPMQPGGKAPFEGELSMLLLASRLSPPELQARMKLVVRATTASQDIKHVACSLWQNPSQESRTWEHFTPESEGATEFEIIPSNSGTHLDSLEIERETTVPVEATNPPLLYPFDQYQATISAECCVNAEPPCSQASRLALRTLHLDYSALALNPGLRPSLKEQSGVLRLILNRLPTFKIVSIALLVVAILFLIYLFVIPKGDDLLKGGLGYFGALWALRGLIVPKEVTVFPTVVDYVVLILFCTLFLGIFAKTMWNGGQDASSNLPGTGSPSSPVSAGSLVSDGGRPDGTGPPAASGGTSDTGSSRNADGANPAP